MGIERMSDVDSLFLQGLIVLQSTEERDPDQFMLMSYVWNFAKYLDNRTQMFFLTVMPLSNFYSIQILSAQHFLPCFWTDLKFVEGLGSEIKIFFKVSG